MPALFLAVMLVDRLSAGVTTDTRWLAIAVPYMFMVGFYEEALVRGLVLFSLLYAWRGKPHGVLCAVIASSAVFDSCI